jgi:hypothetical protein
MSDPKDYLRKMIDHTIDGDMESAEQAFKDYLVPKTKEVMGMGAPEAPVEEPAPEEPVAEEPVAEEPPPEEPQPTE